VIAGGAVELEQGQVKWHRFIVAYQHPVRHGEN
jgi:hypothetical protein